MRTVETKINGRSVELYYSTRAMVKISERCGGDISKLGEYLNADDAAIYNADGEKTANTAKQLERLALVFGDLANGAVIKRNADIALGLETGEKVMLFPDGYFVDVIAPAEIGEISTKIFEVMAVGSEFELPDGVKVEEMDADLKEINETKQKKD